ncbi:hypothetical protein ABIA33_000431 [Streptacidiphilus sp. MAP12-16]|uniref:hypothetical protein n=1 Tax=Streptacidiphilus sp. MAP12-16 TaxID=3156300 RepID=UPI003515F418
MPTLTNGRPGAVVDALARLHHWNVDRRQAAAQLMLAAAESGASPEEIAQVLGEPVEQVRDVVGQYAPARGTGGAALWS